MKKTSSKKIFNKAMFSIMAVLFLFSVLPIETYAKGDSPRATVGDFVIVGDPSGYTYENDVLTFSVPGDYEISMAEGMTQPTTDQIVVDGSTATGPFNITLDGVSIDVSSTGNVCAFEMRESATVNLILKGDNSLKSGVNFAGLQVPEGASIVIDAVDENSSLYAEAAQHGAGIGGGSKNRFGTIIINGGKITARAMYGAGIGGGNQSRGGTVIINGGEVDASSQVAASIGSGRTGSFDMITINGGKVTAKTDNTDYSESAGIGGVQGKTEGTIDISGGLVIAIAESIGIGNADIINISGGQVKADSKKSYGIGFFGELNITGGIINANGGDTNNPYSIGGSSGTITISGGTVAVTAGDDSAGIYFYHNQDYQDSSLAITGGSLNARTITAGSVTNGAGHITESVYLTKVQLAGVTTATKLSSLSITFNGAEYPYGTNDMYTDNSGTLYLYLPEGATVTGAETQSGKYTGTVVTTIDENTSQGTLNLQTYSGDSSYDSSPDTTIRMTTPSGVTVTTSVSGNSASINLGGNVQNILAGGKNEPIRIASNSKVDSYSLKIPVSYLSISSNGSLTLEMDIGNVTIPANMLANIEGQNAQITIGKADASRLPAEVQTVIGSRPVIQITLTVDGKQTSWNNPDAPVIISVPYTPTAEELEHLENIIIWYIDGAGNLICVPRGRYDAETGTVTFTTTHFSDYAVGFNSVQFNDVAEEAWYYKAVSFIAARGITNGTGDGNFSPETNLKRADFLVLLMRTYEIAPDENPADNFADAGDTYYRLSGRGKTSWLSKWCW